MTISFSSSTATERYACPVGHIEACAPPGSTVTCGACAPPVEVGWVETHSWVERLDEFTHRAVKPALLRRALFGWVCDWMDRSLGCPWGQLTWPSRRLWRAVGRLAR